MLSHEIVKLDNVVLLIITLECTAGGTCEERRLLVLDKKDVISELTVGLDISDQTFHKEIEYKFIERNLIELEISDQTFDDNDNLKSDTSYLEYYSINIDGSIEQIDNPR